MQLESASKHNPQRFFFKTKNQCSYARAICFNEILFGKCYRFHSEDEVKKMKQLWGDLKHDQCRKLKEEMQQQYYECSGINCFYLLRGACRKDHCLFDLVWAYRVRRKLFGILCPKNQECSFNTCVFYHQNGNNKIYQVDRNKLVSLIKAKDPKYFDKYSEEEQLHEEGQVHEKQQTHKQTKDMKATQVNESQQAVCQCEKRKVQHNTDQQ